MTTLQVEIPDDLVEFYGLEQIKKFLEDELAYQFSRRQVQPGFVEANETDLIQKQLAGPTTKRVFGRNKGKYKLAPDFDEPLEDFN